MSRVVWKKIKGYPDYSISNYGDVISFKYIYPTYLKIHNRNGYDYIELWENDKGIKFTIHSLVANHFVKGKCKIKRIVNHKDGNKLNNYYKNLEWNTHSHNAKHSWKIGLSKPTYTSKLSIKDVLYIRKLIPLFNENIIADIYEVNRRSINSIKNKKRWKHI